jgi:hypothetical protein
MARLDIRTSDELVQQLIASKPKSLSLSKFCAYLIEEQLLQRGTLGASPGAPSSSYSSSISTSLIKSIVVSEPETQSDAASELPATEAPEPKAKRARKATPESLPAFEAFWKQYLAIQHRANGQTKPAALAEWKQATKEITPEQLQRALTAALMEQTRVVKETGWAAPFPACHRWLAKGYWQQFVEKEPVCAIPVITEIRDPNHPDF